MRLQLPRADHPEHVLPCAVFTYGDRGFKVVAVFLVAAVGVHLAELNRARAASGGRSTAGSARRYV